MIIKSGQIAEVVMNDGLNYKDLKVAKFLGY